MSSVALNVNYYVPKYNYTSNYAFKSPSSEIPYTNLISESVLKENVCIKNGSKASQMIHCNIEKKLHNSLRFNSSLDFTNLSDTNDGFSNLLHRTFNFHKSAAPALDEIIKRNIEKLSGSVILKNEKKNDLDNELVCWCRLGQKYVPLQALGLYNAGNTCYLNSILQCILASGPLLAYISHNHYNRSSCVICNEDAYSRNSRKMQSCCLCGLANLLEEHKNQSRSDSFNSFTCGQTTPTFFVTNIKDICPNFRPYQQEDAHEFLLGLLSRMEDSVIHSLRKMSEKLYESNVIRQIFGGVMRSEVTCYFCRKVSSRNEQWFNLSMDITFARSLQQCLHNYTKSEQLSGLNAYRCENCQSLRSAMRRCTVLRAPPILIIQFNRFSRSHKLDYRVEYPSSFNLRPFMTQSQGHPVIYRLYAIVNHDGHSCRSGHYVSFTRRHGQWLFHNDSYISTTSLDHIMRQSPYLLFYEMIQLNYSSNSTNFDSTPLIFGDINYTNNVNSKSNSNFCQSPSSSTCVSKIPCNQTVSDNVLVFKNNCTNSNNVYCNNTISVNSTNTLQQHDYLSNSTHRKPLELLSSDSNFNKSKRRDTSSDSSVIWISSGNKRKSKCLKFAKLDGFIKHCNKRHKKHKSRRYSHKQKFVDDFGINYLHRQDHKRYRHCSREG